MLRYLLSLTLGAACLPAHALVLGGVVTGGSALNRGGAVRTLVPEPGLRVGDDTFQTPPLYAFDEDRNIVIPRDVRLDIGGAIPAQTVVASHDVLFDPAGPERARGSVAFDADILGVATATATLAATDFLANSDVTYLNPTYRGLEGADWVGIDPDNPRRLLVRLYASSPCDCVRVWTTLSLDALSHWDPPRR